MLVKSHEDYVLANNRELVSLESESELRLQPTVVRSFKKPLAVGSAGYLVRSAKQWRGYVAGNWSPIVVIQQILDGHRDDHVIPVDSSRRPDDSAESPAGGLRRSGTPNAGIWALFGRASNF